MSMNVYIYGVRDIKVLSTDKIEEQTIYFPGVMQTPTKVTYSIVNAENPFDVYAEYIMNTTQEETDDVLQYDENIMDVVKTGETYTYHPGKDHLAELEKWIIDAKNQGYTVKYGDC